MLQRKISLVNKYLPVVKEMNFCLISSLGIAILSAAFCLPVYC